MNYRFKIVSEEAPNFCLEIQINSEANFLQLRNSLLQAAGYSTDELDSFFICDEDWSPKEEIALDDLGADSDYDIWKMADTSLEELIDEEGQRLIFMFDMENRRCFYMEMKEMIFGKDLMDPLCTLREGRAPRQHLPLPEPEKPAPVKKKVADDLDLDFYGDEQYDEEDLPEGLEGEL